MQIRLATTLFIFSFIIVGSAFAKKNSDWLALENGSDCLLMTTEKKEGNLTYPSSLFFNFNKNKRTLGAAVQNFEWGLRRRQSIVQFTVDQHEPKKLNVHLAENLMAVKASEFLKTFETEFKKGRKVMLLNSRGTKVATFSLMGFSKSFKKFSRCAKANFTVARKTKPVPLINSKPSSNTFSLDSSSKQTLKFFLKAAVLFAIANGDLSVGGFMDSNVDFSSSNQIPDNQTYKSKEMHTLNSTTRNQNSGTTLYGQTGVTYRNVGNTIRSSEGESWRKVGNTIRSSSGVSYRQVGNTIRSSEGESWRKVGNTIRSSSGVTWRQVGNTMRSSTGTTCRTVANTYKCR